MATTTTTSKDTASFIMVQEVLEVQEVQEMWEQGLADLLYESQG